MEQEDDFDKSLLHTSDDLDRLLDFLLGVEHPRSLPSTHDTLPASEPLFESTLIGSDGCESSASENLWDMVGILADMDGLEQEWGAEEEKWREWVIGDESNSYKINVDGKEGEVEVGDEENDEEGMVRLEGRGGWRSRKWEMEEKEKELWSECDEWRNVTTDSKRKRCGEEEADAEIAIQKRSSSCIKQPWFGGGEASYTEVREIVAPTSHPCLGCFYKLGLGTEIRDVVARTSQAGLGCFDELGLGSWCRSYEDSHVAKRGGSEAASQYSKKVRNEEEALKDGYRWRKYGQKKIKGHPFPRGYYKCSATKCDVKKQVEKCDTDGQFLVTYEGIHLHYRPFNPILEINKQENHQECQTTTTFLNMSSLCSSSSCSSLSMARTFNPISVDNDVAQLSKLISL